MIDLPEWGLLGTALSKVGQKVSLVKVRFLGIYDTVSSYDPYATNTTTSPNYDNDVPELHLNTISHAKNIIHFCAGDEHRKNFMLTPSKRAGGNDFYLPGVHSDVGGCYTDYMDELEVQIMDLDNTVGDGLDDEQYDTILTNDLNHLIEQGWFRKNEVVWPDSWHQTFINRKGIRNTYSFVTLHLMNDVLNSKYAVTIKESLKEQFGIPIGKDKDGLDLGQVKERLWGYVNGSLPEMKFYTKKEIASLREKHKQKQITTEKLNQIINDHNMLWVLRNKYIHWNSKFCKITGAYEPNFQLFSTKLERKRKIEPNS